MRSTLYFYLTGGGARPCAKLATSGGFATMFRTAKRNEPLRMSDRGPGATICDLGAWRRRFDLSKKVKELEAENARLKRLAAHSQREITALRELLADTSRG
jgi:hypothetical protein